MFKFVIPLIFFVVLIQFILSNIKVLNMEVGHDFGCFYQAGAKFLAKENPYAVCEYLFLRNPPSTLLLYSLFPLFSLHTSQTVFYILSVTAFLIGSFYLFRIVENFNLIKSFKTHKWYLFLIYLSLVLVFFPFRYVLGSGHINNLLFLFLVLTIYFIRKKAYFKAALNLALGISLSVTPIFLLVVFLFEKKFKAIFWTFFNLGIINLIVLLLFGTKIFSFYQNNTSTYFDFNVSAYYNQSLVGFLARLLNNQELTRNFLSVVLIPSLLVFIYYLLKNYQNKNQSSLIFYNVSILFILIFSPYSWQYYFVIIIFPLVVTTYLGYRLDLSYRFFLALAISYLLIAFNIKNPAVFIEIGIFGAIVLSHVFFGAILLVLLNFYLLNRIKNKNAIL